MERKERKRERKERGERKGRDSREDDSGPLSSKVSEATIEKRREQALDKSDCF